MGAILFAMLGGHIVGSLIFTSAFRLVATALEARKQLAGEGQASAGRLVPVILAQSLFQSAPWLVLTTGIFSYHVFNEPWAPWFFGGILAAFLLMGTVLIHSSKRRVKSNAR
jgi:hypothetical protein